MKLVVATPSTDRPALMEVVDPIIRKLLPPNLTDDNTDAVNHTSVFNLIYSLPTPAPSSHAHAIVKLLEQHLAELVVPDYMNGNDTTPNCTVSGTDDDSGNDATPSCTGSGTDDDSDNDGDCNNCVPAEMTLRDLGLFSVMVYGLFQVFVHCCSTLLSTCEVITKS
jgi:hypothetical protein